MTPSLVHRQKAGKKTPASSSKPANNMPEIDPVPKSSEKNRIELAAWYKESKYKDAKFWISPNVVSSSEERIAEVLAAVKKFGEEESKTPDNNNFRL